MGAHGHPYAPMELELLGFVLLQLSILAPYLGTSLFVILTVWPLSGRCRRLSKIDRLLMCWWAFTGLTHIIIEGTFVFTPNFFKRENPNYLDEEKSTTKAIPNMPLGTPQHSGRNNNCLRGPCITTCSLCHCIPKVLQPYYPVHCLFGHFYGCLVYFITAYLDGFNF